MAQVALSNDNTLETWGENYGEEQSRKKDSFNSMIKVLDCLLSPHPPEKWLMCMKPAKINTANTYRTEIWCAIPHFQIGLREAHR